MRGGQSSLAKSDPLQLRSGDATAPNVVEVLERLARLEALLDRLQRERTPNYRAAWPTLQRAHAELMADHDLRFELDEHGDYWLTLAGRPILFVRHQGSGDLETSAPAMAPLTAVGTDTQRLSPG